MGLWTLYSVLADLSLTHCPGEQGADSSYCHVGMRVQILLLALVYALGWKRTPVATDWGWNFRFPHRPLLIPP